jgi:hypothetical protein
MQFMNTKTAQNRGGTGRKQADNGMTASQPRFSPKRPSSHHGLLRGPFFPLIDNPRQRQGI